MRTFQSRIRSRPDRFVDDVWPDPWELMKELQNFEDSFSEQLANAFFVEICDNTATLNIGGVGNFRVFLQAFCIRSAKHDVLKIYPVGAVMYHSVAGYLASLFSTKESLYFAPDYRRYSTELTGAGVLNAWAICPAAVTNNVMATSFQVYVLGDVVNHANYVQRGQLWAVDYTNPFNEINEVLRYIANNNVRYIMYDFGLSDSVDDVMLMGTDLKSWKQIRYDYLMSERSSGLPGVARKGVYADVGETINVKKSRFEEAIDFLKGRIGLYANDRPGVTFEYVASLFGSTYQMQRDNMLVQFEKADRDLVWNDLKMLWNTGQELWGSGFKLHFVVYQRILNMLNFVNPIEVFSRRDSRSYDNTWSEEMWEYNPEVYTAYWGNLGFKIPLMFEVDVRASKKLYDNGFDWMLVQGSGYLSETSEDFTDLIDLVPTNYLGPKGTPLAVAGMVADVGVGVSQIELRKRKSLIPLRWAAAFDRNYEFYVPNPSDEVRAFKLVNKPEYTIHDFRFVSEYRHMAEYLGDYWYNAPTEIYEENVDFQPDVVSDTLEGQSPNEGFEHFLGWLDEGFNW